jgi:hypothetical protein
VVPEKSMFKMAHTCAYGMPRLMGTTSRYMWMVSRGEEQLHFIITITSKSKLGA